jgi:hypothetical protein
MNWAQFHLALNHFPLIGAIFGFLILGWGLIRRNDSVISVGLVLTIFAGLIAIPVFLSGEPAEEIVEHLPGVVESFISSHEDFAKFALISAIISGIVGLAALIYIRIRPQGAIRTVLLLGTLALTAITAGMMGWTAKLGGMVRHTEVRAAGEQTVPSTTENKRGGEKKDEDDDH